MHYKHGEGSRGKITPEYRAWQHMKNRCLNPRADQRRQYQDRGIMVWEGWVHDFPAFLAHVGRRPSPQHSLDRIDNNGSYVPGNVRWATQPEQCSNTRMNCWITYHGRTQTRSQWADELGIQRSTLYLRLKAGWPLERALQRHHTVKYQRRAGAPTA